MWTAVWFGVPLYTLYAYFLSYSFLGWLMESVYVSVCSRKWVNRGFINGPFCPIYGTGALLILLLLEPLAGNLPLLFLGGCIIATVVEFLIGAALEGLFHATWWDYSQKPFQFKGYICLERSLEWGALSVVMVRLIHPAVAAAIAAIPRMAGEVVGTLLFAYLAVDCTITVLHVLQFNQKLAALSEAHMHLREKIESTRLYGTKQEIAAHFENMTAAEVLREWKERMAEENVKLQELREEDRLRLELAWNEIRDKLESRLNALRQSGRVERRLLRAFPALHSKRFDVELKALRRELEEKRTRAKGEDLSK